MTTQGQMEAALASNTAFSTTLPGLQLAIDSTSLGEFKTCPRKYFYSIVMGCQGRQENVHLAFGILLHGAVERYHHGRADGLAHDSALRKALRWALASTWLAELKKPWASDHKTKNRNSLLRSVVWYLDQYGENDAIETLVLANGKPAVELSYHYDSGIKSFSTREPILLCGHFDRLGRLAGEVLIVDVKSTEYQLNPEFFLRFSPDNQFSGYTLAGQVAFSVPTTGLIVDAVQVGVGFSRFQRGKIKRDKAQLAEWLHDTGRWLKQMEACALEARTLAVKESAWPMNDKSCHMYAGCQFRGVCSRSPVERDGFLAANFKQRVWDPLKKRGDV